MIWRDRRTHDEPVSLERRKRKVSMRDADKRLHESMDRFEQTVRIKREDFFRREVSNDIQQTVQFSTYREICSFKVDAGIHRLCRHSNHEAANTGIAKCNEELCPVMRGFALKGAA